MINKLAFQSYEVILFEQTSLLITIFHSDCLKTATTVFV